MRRLLIALALLAAGCAPELAAVGDACPPCVEPAAPACANADGAPCEDGGRLFRKQAVSWCAATCAQESKYFRIDLAAGETLDAEIRPGDAYTADGYLAIEGGPELRLSLRTVESVDGSPGACPDALTSALRTDTGAELAPFEPTEPGSGRLHFRAEEAGTYVVAVEPTDPLAENRQTVFDLTIVAGVRGGLGAVEEACE